MPNYTRPTAFSRSQLLGRANLSILRDNDDYFWGLAHGWRAIPGNLNEEVENGTLFNGWHYYKPDATDLDYWIYKDANDNTRVHLYYDYGGTNQIQVANMNRTGALTSDTLGLYDISVGGTREEGLYRVYCKAKYGGSGHCRPPFTVYTGDESYGTPPLQLDGALSNHGFYNRVRSNDLYFNECKPTNIAFSGMARWGVGAAKNVWDGYDYHFGTRIYYGIHLPGNWDDGNDWCRLYYDYGGTNEQKILDLDTGGYYASYCDIDTTSYSYTPGQRYRVTCRSNSGFAPVVYYLFVEPQPMDRGPGILATEWRYRLMDEFIVGDIVRGRMDWPFDPLPTEISLLSDNDRHIFSALCASAKIGRRDYAVRSPSVWMGGVNYTGELRIVHRYDTLVYRTSGSTMNWGGTSQSLDDYGDDGYETLDLRGLDMAYGQTYAIRGGTVDYAAEIP